MKLEKAIATIPTLCVREFLKVQNKFDQLYIVYETNEHKYNIREYLLDDDLVLISKDDMIEEEN